MAAKPRIPQADISGSQYEVVPQTSEEEVRTRSVQKCCLTAVLESRFLFIVHCGVIIQGSDYFFFIFPGDPELSLQVFSSEDVSTCVETDGQSKSRCIVVIRRLIPLAGDSSQTFLRLYKVRVESGSYWSRDLLTLIFLFK